MWRNSAGAGKASLVQRPGLLLPCYPAKIFLGEVHQVLELPDPVIADVPGRMCDAGLLQQPYGFFMVGAGYVKRVFKSGVMFSES